MERSFEEKRGKEETMTEVKSEGEEESRGEVREKRDLRVSERRW